jgi:O-antigen/teichoic acid export membrane protein
MTTPPQAQVATWPVPSKLWRTRVIRGSAILLLSSGVVAATNLVYNLLIARTLGASGFGHASALYTLLMLVTAVTLSFQIVTSKFVARNSDGAVQAQIYTTLMRRAWLVGFAIAALATAGSAYLQAYLNLPAQHDLVLLAIAAGVYVPVGVRRGWMQGSYNFGGLALNVVVEVAVKFVFALLLLHVGMGVTGVMVAVLFSIVAAYIAANTPNAASGPIEIAQLAEGMQAVLYFVGQVILSNLDILLVKHFFPPQLAGVYAAAALVGRVVFILSWSVVSSMFPITASHSKTHSGRSVLYTALLLVAGIISAFVAVMAILPDAFWTLLLGKQFLLSSNVSFSALLTRYALMTGVYSVAVVVMMYEISRRIGKAAWLQLAASVFLTGGIWWYHNSLSQVILVQAVVMGVLLAVLVFFLALEAEESEANADVAAPLHRLRSVPEDEIIAAFLHGEFYHHEYNSYRNEYARFVAQCDLSHQGENTIRRALLFRRRGRLWRELPADTEWWEIELSPSDLARLQSFPRNEWRRFSGGGFYLTEMVERIQAEMARGEQNRVLRKLDAIATDLREDKLVPNAVLLIGTNECDRLTIIEGNHRMIAAMMTMPESAHRRFRFYCGFSPKMNSCCWHKTDPRSALRYLWHLVRYMFHDTSFRLTRRLQDKINQIGTS